MLTRSIGKFIRGRATPFQILSATILGSLIGFIPGLLHAPALLLILLCILLILNANLPIAAVLTLIAKLLSLALQPVSFAIGRLIIDGPTQPLFKAMINAPVLAWAGMDNYVTVGGMVLGVVLGVVSGLVLIKFLQGFRRKMGKLEEGSEKYKKLTSKKSVKFATFLFVGGKKGKRSWEELTSKRIGNPIRILGVVFAVLLIACVILIQIALGDKIMTAWLTKGLEQANGATVDLDSASIDLGTGKMSLTGLAMADPNKLDTDLLRAKELEADVSNSDLLTRRIAIDRIVVRDASSGEKRPRPGVLVGDRPKPPPPPEGDGKTIDDYIKQAETWKKRLEQLREWIEKGEGRPEEDETEEDKETLRERLERQARMHGYASVRATHLIDGAPSVVIKEVIIDGFTIAGLPGEVFNFHATSLSTQPPLLADPPVINLVSRSGKIEANASLGRFVPASGITSLSYRHDGLSGDKIGELLTVAGFTPVRGGTIDLNLTAQRTTDGINAPLIANLHNAIINIPGVGETDVAQFTLPIEIRGPLSAPRIMLDDAALQQALIDAGKAEAARRLKDEAGKLLDDALGDKAEDAKKKAKDAIGNLLGGGG